MTTTVGYVGLDHHHREPYLASLEQLPVEVTCACEPDEAFDPGAVDGLGDVPVYRDPGALLDAEPVDVVWITLPNRDTPAAIEAAVERGVDVYTEKPAARTAADLEPVAGAAAASDATVAVSYTWRGHPIARDLRERIAAGFLGDARSFEARFVASKVAHRDADHYLFDPAASRGGILQWLGVHWLDLVPWLLDDPIARVTARTSAEAAVDVEDGAALFLETESGAAGTLHCGYYGRDGRYDTHLGAYGTDGRFEWDPMGRGFGFDGETAVELEALDGTWPSTPRRELVHEYEPAPGYGGRWGREFIEAFLDAREGDAPVPAGLDDAVAVLRVLDAAYEAADTGTWVEVG